MRKVALLVVLALLGQACSSDDTAGIEGVGEALREAGIGMVEQISEFRGDQWLTLTSAQLDSMSAEVASGGGIIGQDLDAVTPMPEGAPPFSYWIAAWLHDTPTPRAEIAAAWYPADTDWSLAPLLRFPRAVLLLFVADVAEDTDAQHPPLDPEDTVISSFSPESGADNSPLLVMASAQGGVIGGACELITGFFTTQLSNLFQKLRISKDFLGKGPFEIIGGIFATLWNTVVGLVEGAVEGLVRNLTEPIVQAVGRAVAIAGIISHVSTFVDGWNIEVVADPGQNQLSVGNDPPNTGLFAVKPHENHRPWHSDLKRCADATGVTLPELLSPGAEVRWKVEMNALFYPGPMIFETSSDGVVPDDGRMPEFQYRTGSEESDDGAAKIGLVEVSARASRAELHELFTLARDLIDGIIIGLIPGARGVPALADVLQNELRKLLNPVLEDLERAITTGTSSVLEVAASAELPVMFHEAEEVKPEIPHRPTPPIPIPPTRPGGEIEEPPCDDGCATSIGDPHLTTVDGHGYSFQGAGEFVLIRSNDGSLEIQVRYEPIPGENDFDVSAQTSVAALVGSEPVLWHRDSGVSVHGEALQPGTAVMIGQGRVESFHGGMQVDFADGTVLYVAGDVIVIDPSAELRSSAVGLLSVVSDEGFPVPPLPDGTMMPEPTDRRTHIEMLYRTFGPAWRVSSNTSLFNYREGESVNSFFLADFPNPDKVLLDPSDLPEDLRPRAVASCGAVVDPTLNERCVFDVAVTGDPSWAEPYEVTEALLTQGPAWPTSPEEADDPVTPAPVPGRSGEASLTLTGEVGGPAASTLDGSIETTQGTVLLARIASCQTQVEVITTVSIRDSDDPLSSVSTNLCGSDEFVLLSEGDEFIPTEAYIFLPSTGVHDVSISASPATPVMVDVEVFVDPDPTVVMASGEDLSVFSETYLLEGIGDTVVYALSHPGGIVSFSNSSGFGPGEACGNLVFGAPAPGDSRVWDLKFCGHRDSVFVGHMSGSLVVPMIVFNHTGDVMEVSLGSPD